MPQRIQLRRTKGWRMPPNTVKVARPTLYGNPFAVAQAREAGYRGTDEELAAYVVETFRRWLGPDWRSWWDGPVAEDARAMLLERIEDLRGKDLACFCALGMPCHADVLLELANAEAS